MRRSVGPLTSLVPSPRHGPLIGLGYVRAAHAEPGAVLEIGNATATVAALPFNDDLTP